MKLTKLILTFFLACSLQPAACSLLLAADLELESDALGQGKLRTDTFTFIEQSDVSDGAAAPSGSEGRIAYSLSDSALCVSDGANWHIISGASATIATRIVAVDRNRDSVVDAGDSLAPEQADYVCDGTDDQAEINQAITDCAAAGGGAVYLLDGTYNISGSITMQSNIALIGAGASTVLQIASGASNVKVINAANVSGILISRLRIDGNSLTGSGNYGIYFFSVTYSKIEQVWIEQMRTYGIYLSSSSNNTLSGNNLQGSIFGIRLLSSPNNTFSGNNLQGPSNYGIYLNLSPNNTFSGNNLQGNSLEGFYLINASYNTLSGNNVQGNGTNIGIFLSSSSNNNTLSGNNVQGNAVAIDFVSSSNNIISGNNLQAGFLGIYLVSSSNNNTLSGNTIYNNTQDGIKIAINSDNNLISSNHISKSGSATVYYGINILSGTGNYLVANFIDGTGFAGKISDAGTNTRYTGKDKITLEPVSYAPADAGKINLSSTGTGPRTYVRLTNTGSVTLGNPAIDDGKAVGDLLILENTTNNQVRLTDGYNVQLSPDGSPIDLYQNDTLKLIWDGADWIEAGYANN